MGDAIGSEGMMNQYEIEDGNDQIPCWVSVISIGGMGVRGYVIGCGLAKQ